MDHVQNTTPKRIDLPPVAAISAGLDYAAAVALDGRLFSWGINRRGRMGTDVPTHVRRPALIEYDGAVADAACGADALVAITV